MVLNRKVDIFGQLGIGLWLSTAVWVGITSRSWSSFLSLAAVAAFFIVGSLFSDAMRSTRKPLRVIGRAGTLLYFLVILGFVLLGVERVYLVNASSYPHFMGRDVGAANLKTMEEIKSHECKETGMEVYEKPNQTWVIRCGFSWIDGHTFISSADPYRELGQEGVK